jgi:hypothetical protein
MDQVVCLSPPGCPMMTTPDRARFSPFFAMLVLAGSLPAQTPAAAPDPALARFTWVDVDGDSRLELAVIRDAGGLRLLGEVAEGRFEDVTERAGLSGVEDVALALWADYDGDGWLDLFVGARVGPSRLWKNEGGIFVDVSAESGLASEGAVQSARWLDHDGDGWLDLHLVTSEENALFRGLEGGFFELRELPLASALPVPPSRDALGSVGAGGSVRTATLGGEAAESGDPTRSSASEESVAGSGRASVRRILAGPVAAAMPSPTCVSSIVDQSNPASCLQASTIPVLGRLYPLSASLFVATGGAVGIGTTVPMARLDVAGTARITDTLTLAPGNDQALDVSTGNVYKAGALFLHDRGGPGNTALGQEALSGVTSGSRNTASGAHALAANTAGSYNAACGAYALGSNTTGYSNTASGAYALSSNTTGYGNTASGAHALRSNTTGFSNTASGAYALQANTSGERNTASGIRSLASNTIGSSNVACGAYALGANTTGDTNTASGTFALGANTTGSLNTASGAYALRSNTVGY